jgi:hypothetical protein
MIIIAAILLIIIGASPIVFWFPPFPSLDYSNAHPASQWLGKGLVIVVLAAVTRLVWRRDGGTTRGKVIRYCGFALVAGLLTDIHYNMVDLFHLDWQIRQFYGILIHSYQPPDQYRFIPQGVLWWLNMVNGDFVFSYLTYRFFFTFLLCHAIYRLARLYLPAQTSVLVVFLYGAFYTLSTRYYYGNLLDPMSHLVMLTAFYYCHQRKFWCFFWLFVLGVFIKETMLLLAPCYYLMNFENTTLRKDQNWQRIVLLGVVGMTVFFACRLPFHFNYSFQSLNRTPESMVYANLGIGHPQIISTVSVFMRYLHPILFLFMWLPLIVCQRRRLPASLFWTSLYLVAGLYGTNTFFGWNYESRNFIPGLVLLVICTLVILNEWVVEKPAAGGA